MRWLAMKHAAEHSGYDSNSAMRLANAAFGKFMAYRNDVEIYADVMPVLTRLRRDYLLCSLTNGNADLMQIGIHHIFHHNLSAERVGAAKPAPKIFREACRLAGVHPSSAVHVGDDPDNDIIAARAAGMKTIWDRTGTLQSWPHIERADAEVRSLSELGSHIRQFAAATA
ncbi:MAG: HAD family hydrolase [Gammaproteobacteria bacterium]|nr:HAD family hydrolase [Gammaproteobacteria bacterium]